MTTLSVDDELFQLASEAAAAQGKSVDEFADEALRSAVSRTSVRQSMRNGIPVMIAGKGIPPIDPARIRQAIEEEGF